MESDQASTSYSTTTSLFPAYSSHLQNLEEKKDWLENASFTESAFKEVCSQLSSHQNADTPSDSIAITEDEKIPLKKEKQNKSHKKRKYEKYSDPSAFSVPESESIISQLKKKTFIEETGLSFERAFHTDSTRDPDNLMYECFERSKTASYHSSIKTPIGLSTKELLYWTLSLPKRKEKAVLRYFSKKFLKEMKTAVNEDVHPTKEPLENVCLNYIPISVSSHFMQSENTESVPGFINVSSSWKSEKPKSNEAPDNKTTVESEDSELRDKIIYYNKKLSEEPKNVDMWMDFVEFQNRALTSKSAGKDYVYSEKSIIEKKIAILDKALKYNPKNLKLNVMRLKLHQNLYGPEKLTSMWEDLIFFSPNNPLVWQEYLLYSMSNLMTSTVSSNLKLYVKCLRTLSNVSEGEIESHEASPDIIPFMLRIFDQVCCILSSCGFTEKAVGAHQALIELNFFGNPEIDCLSVNEKITCLEPFWDSCAQRVGEKNALGWAATVQEMKISFDHISTDSDLNNMEDEILSKKLTVPETWLEFERLRDTRHWVPWKPNPEYDQTSDDVDDTERTVSFDDVSKFLFSIREEEHKFLLIMQFIMFLGFDPHSLGCYNLKNGMTYNPYNLDDYKTISHELNHSQLIHQSVNPFPSIFPNWHDERYNFTINIFSQVVNKFTLKYRMLCTFIWVKFQKYFAIEVNDKKDKDVAHLKKSIKGILKKNENRNCLLLWFEYISIEWLSDKLSAIKTFKALLLSSTSAVSLGNMQLPELWYFVQAFIDIYTDDSENSSSKVLSSNEILWILIHVANKEKYVPYSNQEIKPTVILKTVSGFKSALDKELNLLDTVQSALCYCFDPYIYSVINCAKCFAYFQYFSQGCEAALQVFESVISFIGSQATEHMGKYISEQLHTAQAKILNFHTWNSTASIKPLQTFLCNSVKKYPHNSQLLYLLVKLRSASSVISPTRRFLFELLKNHHKSHPVTWFFALITEFAICSKLLLQKHSEENSLKEIICGLGINWKIRSLYEKMLQCDVCVHIPILWRSYLKFEVMTQNTEKAKSIFHRSLQNCGWSKELLMDAIEYFPGDLQEILAFMTEKHIRIRTPLEEVKILMEHVINDP